MSIKYCVAHTCMVLHVKKMYICKIYFSVPWRFLLHRLSSVLLINGLDEGHIVHITTIGVLELGHNKLMGIN